MNPILNRVHFTVFYRSTYLVCLSTYLAILLPVLSVRLSACLSAHHQTFSHLEFEVEVGVEVEGHVYVNIKVKVKVQYPTTNANCCVRAAFIHSIAVKFPYLPSSQLPSSQI
jgi:hypothetical protein